MITDRIAISNYQSPAGELILGSYRDGLCLCAWTHGKRRDDIYKLLRRRLNADFKHGTSCILADTADQLDEYFQGTRTSFTIPLLITGTPFQHDVWTELTKIPYGMTISYAGLALRTGNPQAVRAVASANAVNPISILVPCHRVIGSDHRLTGYGGGLEAKQMLLALETRGALNTLPL